jgi:tripartite-type tricarboxylate transporter receptor subunit TctC
MSKEACFMRSKLMTGFVGLIALGAALAFPAHAQWPAKPVRVITSHPPGGTVDQLARILADELARAFGRPFVVDSRAGANGDVAAEQLLAAPADGYTVMVSPHGPFVTNMFLRKQSFDHATAFAPVTPLATAPLVLVVHPSVPARNLAELLAWLRAQGGRTNYASQGIGSSGHFAMELFMKQAGFQASHVPYKGTGGATLDLLSGNVSMMFDTATTALLHVRSGKLRGIAVAEPRRLPGAPDLPTVAETLPGFDAAPWYALATRAGTPSDIVERLAGEWARVAARPEIRERFSKVGVELQAMTPSAFRGYIRSEYEKWGAISRAAGAKNE